MGLAFNSLSYIGYFALIGKVWNEFFVWYWENDWDITCYPEQCTLKNYYIYFCGLLIFSFHFFFNSLPQWSHLASNILVNNGLGNGLLFDGIKLLPEPMLIQDYCHPFQCKLTGNVQNILAKIINCCHIFLILVSVHQPQDNELMCKTWMWGFIEKRSFSFHFLVGRCPTILHIVFKATLLMFY